MARREGCEEIFGSRSEVSEVAIEEVMGAAIEVLSRQAGRKTLGRLRTIVVN